MIHEYGPQFLASIEYGKWIELEFPKTFYGDKWCFYTHVWSEIQRIHFEPFSKFDVLLDEGHQKFKKVTRIEKFNHKSN